MMKWQPGSALPTVYARPDGLVILAHYGDDTDLPIVLVWRVTSVAAGSFRSWFGYEGQKYPEPRYWMPGPQRPTAAAPAMFRATH